MILKAIKFVIIDLKVLLNLRFINFFFQSLRNLRFIKFLKKLCNLRLRFTDLIFFLRNLRFSDFIFTCAIFACVLPIKNFGCAICACALKFFICAPTSA